MLRKCNELRTVKIKEVELEAATNSTAAHPAVGEALKKRLENTKEMIELILEAAGNLRDQEENIMHSDEARYSKELALLRGNCNEWWSLFNRIPELMEEYEKHHKERVRAWIFSVEEKLGKIWKDAVHLMKSQEVQRQTRL
jgi:hypothetical protein